MKIKLFFLLTIVSLFLSNKINSQQFFTPNWDSLRKKKAVPEWFTDARFGVYFHWGIYSVPANGNEWYPRWMYVKNYKGWGEDVFKYHKEKYGDNFHYHDFIPMWKATNFNAEKWVDAFESMGAKIIGAIAEHHDGFSLWDSQINEWNSKKMGPKIDVLNEIKTATKKRNLKFMVTFHHGFHNVFYPKKKGKYLRNYFVDKYMYFYYDTINVPQEKKYSKLYGNLEMIESYDLWLSKLNEVIYNYSPDYIYTDFGQSYIPELYRKVFLANYFNHAASQNKSVVVNTKGDYFPKDIAIVNIERSTIENISKSPWVTDFKLGSSWAYNQYDRSTIDPKKAIRILAEVVSKNGIMILSAGPKPNGEIPEEQLEAMNNIGEWMKAYGECIYNTKPFIEFGQGTTKLTRDDQDLWNDYGEIKKGLYDLNYTDIRYTTKNNLIYAIQLGWNSKQKSKTLRVFSKEKFNGVIRKISVLGSSEKISWKKTHNGLIIRQPKKIPFKGDYAIVYKIVLEK